MWYIFVVLIIVSPYYTECDEKKIINNNVILLKYMHENKNIIPKLLQTPQNGPQVKGALTASSRVSLVCYLFKLVIILITYSMIT